MRLSKTMLTVMVNPFCAPLGEDGRAQALVAHDPSEQIGRDYVGARVLPLTVDSKARKGNPFGPSVKAVVSYRLAPEKVPHTPHYVSQLKSGETFPADAETARAVGVPFLAPALERVRGAASKAARSFDGSVIEAWTKQGLADVLPVPEQVGGVEIQDIAEQALRVGAEDKEGDA